MLMMAHNRALLDQLCDEMRKMQRHLSELGHRFTVSSINDEPFRPDATVILSTAGKLAGKMRSIDCRGVALIVADEVRRVARRSGY